MKNFLDSESFVEDWLFENTKFLPEDASNGDRVLNILYNEPPKEKQIQDINPLTERRVEKIVASADSSGRFYETKTIKDIKIKHKRSKFRK